MWNLKIWLSGHSGKYVVRCCVPAVVSRAQNQCADEVSGPDSVVARTCDIDVELKQGSSCVECLMWRSLARFSRSQEKIMSGHHHHHHDVCVKKLFWAIVLNIIITLSQIVGGVLSGSLALLSDALHNFSDVLSLVIACAANRLARRPSSKTMTFGYKRAEILAAMFNSSVLAGIGVFLIIEAIQKLAHPEIISSVWVISLGVLSIVLNSLSVLLIKNDTEGNVNIKAAYLHLLTDVMTSIAVVTGGILIYYFQLYRVDAIISILIAVYLIYASTDILKECSNIIMEGVPDGISIKDIAARIKQIPGVSNMHHVHIWRLNDKEIHLQSHIECVDNIKLLQADKLIDEIEKILHDEYGIEHTTLQLEYQRRDKVDSDNKYGTCYLPTSQE